MGEERGMKEKWEKEWIEKQNRLNGGGGRKQEQKIVIRKRVQVLLNFWI